MYKLLLGTSNPGKIMEYSELLHDLPYSLTTPLFEPSREGVVLDVDETGDTFEKNALIKAHHFSRAFVLPTLADDSGLEVDALNGEPGVRSARYGGPGLSDFDRVALLLSKIRDVPWEQRTARFRCVIALVWLSGSEEIFEGVCDGYINYEAKGENGFGYDSVFFYPKLGVTFAELDSATKNGLSHRGQAARNVVQRLRIL